MITVMLGFGLLMNIGIHRDVRLGRTGESQTVDQPAGSDIYRRPEGQFA